MSTLYTDVRFYEMCNTFALGVADGFTEVAHDESPPLVCESYPLSVLPLQAGMNSAELHMCGMSE